MNDITKAARKVAQLHEVSGLFSCLVESEISKANAKLKWTGPRFDDGMWQQVCAFLKWAKKEHHSEAQVRLYVNTHDKIWAAWAYPQECSCASTKELENDPKFAEQRKQFDQRWRQFGTVHSHPGSAFQSSTDESDEKAVDGIHITMGNLDQKTMDIHCRFYLAHNEINPDMSWFFNVGDVTSGLPKWVRQFIPSDISDRVARTMMCVPPPDKTEFPKEWKENFIVPKTRTYGGWTPSGSVDYQCGMTGGFTYKRSMDGEMDLKRMYDAAVKLAENNIDQEFVLPDGNVDAEAFMEWLEECVTAIGGNPGLDELCLLLWRNDCTPDGILAYAQRQYEHLRENKGKTQEELYSA